jgi:hypothetical protein
MYQAVVARDMNRTQGVVEGSVELWPALLSLARQLFTTSPLVEERYRTPLRSTQRAEARLMVREQVDQVLDDWSR